MRSPLWLICCAAVFAACGVAVAGPTWARGLLGAPLLGPNEKEPRFYAVTIDARADELTADCTFDNRQTHGRATGVVRLHGWRDRNGAFRPDATLAVSTDEGRSWRRVRLAPRPAKRQMITIRQGQEYAITVDLSPLKPFVETGGRARIVLETGDIEGISLSDLLPPKA